MQAKSSKHKKHNLLKQLQSSNLRIKKDYYGNNSQLSLIYTNLHFNIPSKIIKDNSYDNDDKHQNID